MRIISGRHKGRRLLAPKGKHVRPTAERAREAVFNILGHGRLAAAEAPPVTEARVLDAFAGTGALALEALSRGARHATMMERDGAALAAAKANAERLGEAARVTCLRADAAHPPPAPAPCDLLFLDPPYDSGLAVVALSALDRRGWIAPEALAVVEIGAREAFDPPAGFAPLDTRVYGAARIVILRRIPEATSPDPAQAGRDGALTGAGSGVG